MKTAEQIADSVIPWSIDGSNLKERSALMDEIKAYATAAIKEHLSRAAENARIVLENDGLMDYHCVDKRSILDTPIELP